MDNSEAQVTLDTRRQPEQSKNNAENSKREQHGAH